VLPQHLPVPGGSRIRQSYQPNEVAHFEFDGHRWAIVAEPDTVDTDARGRNDANGTNGTLDGPQSRMEAVLTNREMQIVQLICNGLLTKQVSDRLRISEFTVRSYLKTIYCKLGVRSRGAMVYAYARSVARAPQGPPPGDA
jgi:DNA-binding CsgD family transcriptional regulator